MLVDSVHSLNTADKKEETKCLRPKQNMRWVASANSSSFAATFVVN